MKKKITIIGLILLLIFSPIVIGDWPMYQHDAANTGYSQASFPNSFNQIWFKSYIVDLNINMIAAFNSPVTSNGKIFIIGDQITDNNGLLCALNQNNGSLIWKTEITPFTKYSFQGTNSPAVYNGKIYVTLNSLLTLKSISKLICLDENTGDILWEKSFFGTTGYSSVTIADDKVFVGGHFTFRIPISWLSVFDAVDGELLWRKTLFGYLESTSAVYENKVIVTTGPLSGILSEKIISLFSRKSRVYVFNINDGQEIWKKRVEGCIIQSSPAVANDIIFISTNKKVLNKLDCKIYGLDIEIGDEIWHQDINQKKGGSWPSSISSPSVGYGKVFVTDSDGCLHVYNQENGDLIWEKEILLDNPNSGSDVFASPVIIDEKVIVGANDDHGIENNELFMFNESSGELIWNIKLNGSTSAPFIVSNEMLFVNDGFNKRGIFAFG